MAGKTPIAVTSSSSIYSASPSSTLLLLLLRQVVLMSTASSDFKAAAYGAFFGAVAALLVSHLLLELTFSAVFSSLFALLFFCLSLLVLHRACALRTSIPPPALPRPTEQGEKLLKQQQQQDQQFRPPFQQQQHSRTVPPGGALNSVVLATKTETQTKTKTTTTEDEEEKALREPLPSAPPPPTSAAGETDISKGDVEDIFLEEERDNSESEALLLPQQQQEQMQQHQHQQDYLRREKQRMQMRRMLFGLAAMLAVSALVAAVLDTRKFQTFHWLLKMPVYIFLSNSLCFLLVFAAVDVFNFYYDIATHRADAERTDLGVITPAATSPTAFTPSPEDFSFSNHHYFYAALSTSACTPSPPPAAGYSSSLVGPPSFSTSPSLPLAANTAVTTGVGSTADGMHFPTSMGSPHSHFRSGGEGLVASQSSFSLPAASSAQALAAAAAAGSLPVHNTLQVYVLLAGSLLLGTTFGFFYGLFRFETSPHISIQLIRSRYVCLPLAVIIGSLAGVLVKRIGDLSATAAAGYTLQQQHYEPSCGPLPPFLHSASLAAADVRHSPTTVSADSPFDVTTPTAAADAVAVMDDDTRSLQPQQLFPITAAASFLEADEEEEEVEEENLLTFSAAEQRQLLLLA